MGLLSLIFGKPSQPKGNGNSSRPLAPREPPGAPIKLLGDGLFGQEIVGESYYQGALEGICGGKCEDGHELEAEALLSPEPSNPYDKNAVAISVRGKKVGHLSRTDAVRFHQEMTALGHKGKAASCRALINGGWLRTRRNGAVDEGHYGVELDLEWPLRTN